VTDDPTPTDPGTDADRAWLRRHLDPIVARTADDRWEELADGASLPGPAPLASGSTPPRGRRALAVAAAIAVVLGAVAVARPWSGGDGEPAEVIAAEPPPTGWYVPMGLPEGWALEYAEAHAGGPACERRGFQWTDPAGEVSVGLAFDACGEVLSPDDLPTAEDLGIDDPARAPSMPQVAEVDLGGGIVGVGTAIDGELRSRSASPLAPDQRSIAWEADGGTWTLRTLGLGEPALLDAARALVPDPDDAEARVGELIGADIELVERWTAPARERTPQVQLGLVAPDGRQMGLHLYTPGTGDRPAGDSFVVPEVIAGQPLEVWRFDDIGWAGRFGGAWPGADVTIYRWAADPADWIDDDSLRTFIASLRPASAEQWRAFLDTATGTVPDELRTAATLADLYADGEVPSSTMPSDPPPATGELPQEGPDGTVPATSPTTLPVAGATRSAPATILPEPEAPDSYSDLSGLEVRLEVDAATVRTGDALGARLAWTNTTDEQIQVNECTEVLIQPGFVPIEDPDGPLPAFAINDCYDTPRITVPAGETVTTALRPERGGLEARRAATTPTEPSGLGGPLDPGLHLAVVLIPGRTSTLRIELPIEVAA
jgi:hypothetical protein